MRIIGQPRCSVQALEQSESEIGKVILNFTTKFFVPGGESESSVVFHRIFVAAPEIMAALAMNDDDEEEEEEEEGRYIATKLLELLQVPTLDEIVDPVLVALVSVSKQMTYWSLGLKAAVTIDLAVQTLPSDHPPLHLSEVVHLYINDEDHDDDDDDDDYQVRFVPANESSIRALETVRVSTAEMECSVCMEDLTAETEATRLPCSHTFHGDCILKWLNTSNFCPLCRFQINT